MSEAVDPAPPFADLEDRILPWSQVKVISGLSRTTVWRLQKTGDFPAAVQVSRNRIGWWQSEILEWRRSRIPRRLPQPKCVPEETPPKASAPAAVARAEEPPEPVSQNTAPAPARRGRKRPEAPGQGAFDFGG